MSEIDHRGIAEHLAETASENEQAGRVGTAMFEVSLAQVHATLAASANPPGPPWTLDEVTELAAELRKLRAAVQPALAYLDQIPGARDIAVQLRKLVR